MRSEGLGIAQPISLMSDPSEIQGDKKMVFWTKSMDSYDANRIESVEKALSKLPAHDMDARLKEQDRITKDRLDHIADKVERVDNWDGETDITDAKRIKDIIHALPSEMSGELFLAQTNRRQLLLLKNPSPSGSNAETTHESTEGRTQSESTTPSTATPASAPDSSKSARAGKKTTSDPSDSSAEDRPAGTRQLVQ